MQRALVVAIAWGTALVAVLGACGDKGGTVAKLTAAEGPVDKETGGKWGGAKVGTTFKLGDAAKTGDKGGATLLLTGGKAQIAMKKSTTIRFGGTGDNAKIQLTAGIIDLTGDVLSVDKVGKVNLKGKGKVTISALGKDATGKDKFSIMAVEGVIDVTDASGDLVTLTVDVETISVDGEIDLGTMTVGGDAGVPDAAPVVDAAVVASDKASYAITGGKAEILPPGETKWQPLAEGAGDLAAGAKLRLGAGTTAKLSALGVTLDMKGGSGMTLNPSLLMTLDKGDALASTLAGVEGKVNMPGGAPDGALTLTKSADGSSASIGVNARESKITLRKGSGNLKGSAGGEQPLVAGESATLAKNGTIRQTVQIPKYFDFRLDAGQSATIHDYSGATAVQFSWGEKCPGGGFVELDNDNRFQTAAISPGKDSANILVRAGGWAYRVRCNGSENTVASGRLGLQRDSGNRPLLKPTNIPIDPDGRTYRIDYQSSVPDVTVNAKGAGTNIILHIATGGKEQTYTARDGKVKVPGKTLEEGDYTYYLERDGVKDKKISTLKIGFDNTAPQVYVERPVVGKAWENPVLVRGAILEGWTASVEGVDLPANNKQRRFNVSVQPPAVAKALAIRLAHPQRGVHYYIRRNAAAAKP